MHKMLAQNSGNIYWKSYCFARPFSSLRYIIQINRGMDIFEVYVAVIFEKFV